MLILNAREVAEALSMPDAVDAMKQAWIAISERTANLPLRTHIDVKQHSGTTLVMPAHVNSPSCESLTVKVVSVFGNNPDQKNMARIQAAVIVLDPETGEPIALLEGSSLTKIRTAAASGAATDALARTDSSTLAILGAGVQAQSHLAAMRAVRPI
jgi:ornithine cyclodeaminase